MPEPTVTKLSSPPFIELQSVDSTNNYALAQIHAGLAQHGMSIFAHEQVAGKGQRGKGWMAEKDANIILSVVINPVFLQPAQQFWLSACAAVAVHEFFAKYAGSNSKIKWPNDLYWQDRKAGGILIESVVRSQQSAAGSKESAIDGRRAVAGSWQWAVVGIGININQISFSSGLKNPVSLRQISGNSFDPLTLAKEFCTILHKYYEQLHTEGFDRIYAQYLTHLYKKNELVRLKKDSRIFEAAIKTVSPGGRLVVQHSIEEEFEFGEVEWMIE